MLLSLIRINESPNETTGILLIGGKPFCGTLEPPVVPNATHPKGAIPLGWYKLTLTKSAKFGRVLPLLHFVPRFEGIRMHAGNIVEHTSGCILVGQLSGNTLLHSRQTEKDLVSQLQKHYSDETYIEITTPERFFTEHCSNINAVYSLLRSAQFDRDKPFTDND